MDHQGPRDPEADLLRRAGAGDGDAFERLVRPHLPAVALVAAAATADVGRATEALRAAVAGLWREIRAVSDPSQIVADLDLAALATLTAALRATPSGGRAASMEGAALTRAFRSLRPRERALLAACVGPTPTPEARSVAAGLGVEDPATASIADGGAEIINLDGPLAGWAPDHLRAALRSRADGAVPADLTALVAGVTIASRPAGRLSARLRRRMPPLAATLGAAAAAVALAAGIGTLSLATFAASPSPPVAAVVATPDARAAAPTPAPAQALLADPPPGFAPFPPAAAGLTVVDVPTALEVIRAGDPGPVAVKGWWSATRVLGACSEAGIDAGSEAASFCRRTAILSIWAEGGYTVSHLHIQIPAGLDHRSIEAATRAVDGAVPVVVIGHFSDARAIPCTVGTRHCGENFVLDRLAWVDRIWTPVPAAITPSGAPRTLRMTAAKVDELVNGAFPPETMVFSMAAVPSAEIGSIEPLAARAAREIGGRRGSSYAWLVRVASPIGSPSATPAGPFGGGDALVLGWVLVNDAEGRIVTASPAP